MSDMVQQPVIQLVQDLTMTAVVERHDCTDTKRRKKKSSPRPRLNSNYAFVIHPFLENTTDLSRQMNVNHRESPGVYWWLSQN